MPTPDKQADDQESAAAPMQDDTGISEKESIDIPDDSEEMQSEVAMRINLLGKLVIPPPHS